ncbi:hydantoinase/oxoprolinase family protein [Natrialbaceae archaeon A-CW2]
MTASPTPWRLGVDVGGTFTDVVTVSDGAIDVIKTPSSPQDPSRAVLRGTEEAQVETTGDTPYAALETVAHGTTVATNAVLEREWADTALITTEGFRDVLEIGRQARPAMYDLATSKPDPIVGRDRRYEVSERLDERGTVETPLSIESVEAVAEALETTDVDSIAIALLFSFENDDHERLVKTVLERSGIDASFSLSCDVHPEIREYERTLLTALNAALKPRVDSYIGNLEKGLDSLGITAPLQIMQSNGGVLEATQVREQPVRTLLSGPAAGVQAAAHIASSHGFDTALTMDMGGTSCDVSLVRDGTPVRATDLEIGEYPITLPMISIHTIGAGGGSVGWIDDGGALRVGPESAGAVPGPICYGRGGTDPTVSDAHAILGRLDPDSFETGDRDVTQAHIEAQVADKLADPLEMEVEAAAAGILEVANASMERALRVMSVERGYDPRSFALVAFGGAGPLHATALAESLEIPTVVVPHSAGVLSALGLLVTDRITEQSASMVRRLEEIEPSDLDARFERFERESREKLGTDVDTERLTFERALDLRYVGQSFDLTIELPDDPLTSAVLETVTDRFHRTHERRYGHAAPEEPLEIVTLRTRTREDVDPPALTDRTGESSAADAVTDERSVLFEDTSYETPVYDRTALAADVTVSGPGIFEGAGSTTVLRPGQRARVEDDGTLIIEVNE